ncbi:hypothetical protein [Proteiniclasticum sp. QWL-01]|uniref:hypothetical protein n=1 Tax=Proteiniclasticum sp. QWL-01 TaxID=3036945 RepID=UPI0024116F17|nr:hypothetical protein [Proteiniclasticum sp. QWL-01]WFF73987.1 hypothetical protein P6M73_05940 [Proteiniclasticum sp. QWL-01]
MKKGMYILKFEDEGEEVYVEVLGGIGTEEVAQLFGFCVCALLDAGADVDELHAAIDKIKAERNEATV